MVDENKNVEDTEPIAPPPVAHHRDGDYMSIASERLSQVRYVFIVQIEDGVPSAHSRACLEYADAVLMGWPDANSNELEEEAHVDQNEMKRAAQQMEKHIVAFRLAERADQTHEMGEELVQIALAAATIRHAYQPSVAIPTIDEISRVVSEEWKEEIGSIDAEELESSEELRHDVAIAKQNGPNGNIPSARELQEKREHRQKEEEHRRLREQQDMNAVHSSDSSDASDSTDATDRSDAPDSADADRESE